MKKGYQLAIAVTAISLGFAGAVKPAIAITHRMFQSDTVKLPVASIPSRQLNLRPDTNLIAGEIRDKLSDSPRISSVFQKMDDIWSNPANRPKRLLDYCNTQKQFPVRMCVSLLHMWALDKLDSEGDNITAGNIPGPTDNKDLQTILHTKLPTQ